MIPPNGSPKHQSSLPVVEDDSSSDPGNCTPPMSSPDKNPSSPKHQSSAASEKSTDPESSGDVNQATDHHHETIIPLPEFKKLLESSSYTEYWDNGNPVYIPKMSAIKRLFEEQLQLRIEATQAIQQNNAAGRSNVNFVKTITDIFNKDDIVNAPISIFKVPESLISAKPEAYVPQQVGLGPIHHLRRDLQYMQMYKVREAKRIHEGFQSGQPDPDDVVKFGRLIQFLSQIAIPSVRASYNIYLDMEDGVLACQMAVDGLFLFNLLCCHGINDQALGNSSSLCHLVSSSGRRLAQEATIREAMMLENQIPILVLEIILIIECPPISKQNKDTKKDIVKDLFPEILLGFCEFVKPLKIAENYPPYEALNHAHLLDLLYHLVTLEHSPEGKDEEKKKVHDRIDKIRSAVRPKMARSAKDVIRNATALGKKLGLPFQPLELLQDLLDLPVSDVRQSIDAAREKVVVKESFIPTASELDKAGVKFSGDVHIRGINFDPNALRFHLPVITINAQFEVVFRNLVAYEAMIKSETEPSILNWFVELTNGLIQSAEDVRVLKEKNILKVLEPIDDEQVAKIFSGMNKAIELKNIPDGLNKAVNGVKNYYNKVWWVSMLKSTKKWWLNVSKWGHVVAVVLIVIFMAIQSFCSVYECRRFSSKINSPSPARQADFQLPSLRSHLM